HASVLVLAIEEIAPLSPLHLLILPREHIGSAADLRDTPEHAALLARMHAVAATLADEAGYGDRGWRLVSNVGLEGGQAIEHLHYHLLAGRQLNWPPG
ncbi:MAG: HIT domain-containing protein, partial [Candidatus Limnocylindrus sp.]